MQPLYTIGHSDRELADVLALLQGTGVARLADVRAFTRSRTKPGFNEATFPTLLAAGGVENRHFAALGGAAANAASRGRSVRCGATAAFTTMPIMRSWRIFALGWTR